MLLSNAVLKKHETLLLLKSTLDNAKVNTALAQHIDMGRLEAHIRKLDTDVKELLKGLASNITPPKKTSGIKARHGRSAGPPSRRHGGRARRPAPKDDSDYEDSDELDEDDTPKKSAMNEDDIFALARHLASADGYRKWGSQAQKDWAGFAKKNDKRGRRAWRNWYIGNPSRKDRIDALVKQYQREIKEQAKDMKDVDMSDSDSEDLMNL